jgi:molecular chaperone DnaK
MFDIDIDGIDSEESTETNPELENLFDQAQKLLATLEAEQANELQDLLDRLEDAIADGETAMITQLQEEIADFVYYVNNNP